jgi:hypothetical protein
MRLSKWHSVCARSRGNRACGGREPRGTNLFGGPIYRRTCPRLDERKGAGCDVFPPRHSVFSLSGRSGFQREVRPQQQGWYKGATRPDLASSKTEISNWSVESFITRGSIYLETTFGQEAETRLKHVRNLHLRNKKSSTDVMNVGSAV